ncbi:putative small auxin-up RNA [Helianthus debilis subsp. tardiflorus]
MLGKKIGFFKKLAMTIKVKGAWSNNEPSKYKVLTPTYDGDDRAPSTPIGFFAIYVGEERQRFLIPTHYLSHPLFRMLLEKAHKDMNHKSRLVMPCSVSAFLQVVSMVNCSNGMFDIGQLVEQLI